MLRTETTQISANFQALEVCSSCKSLATGGNLNVQGDYSRKSFHLRIQEEEAGLAHFLPPLGRILPYSQILQEELGLPRSGDTERFKFQTSNCTSRDKLTKDNKEDCPCPLVNYIS